MPHVMIRHNVTDFVNWKPMNDAHGTAQKTSGSQRARLFRTADNPSETVILLEWSDLDSARRFIGSEDPRQATAKAGVADRPNVYVLDEAGRSDA